MRREGRPAPGTVYVVHGTNRKQEAGKVGGIHKGVGTSAQLQMCEAPLTLQQNGFIKTVIFVVTLRGLIALRSVRFAIAWAICASMEPNPEEVYL